MTRRKKKLKKLGKISILLIGIGFLFYFGLYIYAKYATKLVIDSANEFYIYDTHNHFHIYL